MDIPSELMKDNELLKAENCWWDNGITKRGGISTYSTTDFTAMVGFKGSIRCYINTTWYTIIAIDDNTDIRFYAGTGTTFAEIDATFTFTRGTNVEMAELLGHVVMVNGVDKPAVVYWDSALVVENLEIYDTRTRSIVNWYAGQFTPWTLSDDTTDAQDAGTADFQIGSTVVNEGFYIACDYTFNKVIFHTAEQATGSPAAYFQYWNGTAWAIFTTTTIPDWDGAAGDRTWEFDLPLDSDGTLLWQPYAESGITGVTGKYVARARFSIPADAIFSCAYLSIYNTQYLTQILQDERPHLVRAHNSQIYMASYNIVNFSPPYYVTGWREGQSEHFDMGGSKIMDMVSFADTLVVGKENTLYTWSTSNLMDPIRSRPLTTVGPIASRSMVQIGNYVTFVARDGIYMWDGSNITKLSKHIKTDFDSWTNTSASAAVYNNHCLISFPDDSVVLVFDPDTFRLDDMGDGRVSFYKWTGYKATQLLNCNGAGDTGYLLAVVDQDDPYVARGDYGTQDNILAAVNIEMNCQTKYFSDGNYQVLKGFGRLKVKVKEVSDRAGARHRVTMYSDDGVRYEHAFMLVPKGTGYYTEDIRVPYTISGTLYGFGLRHNAPTSATLTGFTIENFERSY